jgi:HPt (histidine-containing phosphotransfer) domain-containing protein
MQDYITKPVEPEKLYAALSRWLGKALPTRTALASPETGPTTAAELQLSSVTGIDASFGLRNVGGNGRLYVELLDRFRGSQRDAGCSIQSDLDGARLVEVAVRAHALRGVAGNVGARELQALAQEIEEEAGRANPDLARLASSCTALRGSLDGLMDALDTYFAKVAPKEAIAPPSGTSALDAAKAVAQLEAMLAEFSGEATDFFDTVRGPLGRLLGPGALARLEAHLSRYEFEEARLVLSQAGGGAPSIAEHI